MLFRFWRKPSTRATRSYRFRPSLNHSNRRLDVETLEERAVPALTPVLPFSAGVDPNAVVVGDFNGDGKLDVASANFGSTALGAPSCVSVLFGNGDGTLQLPTCIPTGAGTIALAAGDFNGDGKQDLIAVNLTGDSVSVLLNNGNSTFQTPINTGVGTSPSAVAVGDFNKDGKLDVAVANASNNNVNVLIGKGDGTFQSPVSYATGSLPDAIFSADLNNDGKLDLVVTNAGDPVNGTSSTLSILYGKGDGTFQSSTSVSVADRADSVAVADVNGDGKLDLVVTNAGTPSTGAGSGVNVFIAASSTTYLAPTHYAAGVFPLSVKIADLNGDGRLDIVTANAGVLPNGSDSNVTVLQGFGNGTFQAAVPYPSGAQTDFVAVGDFNNDGVPDLAVTNSSTSAAASANIGVLLNPGTTHVQFSAPSYNVGEGAGTATITVTRSGTMTNKVTVQFATSDGAATGGSDYTLAAGTLTFNPGDSTKTFTIGITNDTLVEGNETVKVTLSSPTGGATVVNGPATATLTIHDDDGTATQRYVSQIYLDFLGRQADAVGLAYWSNVLDQGGARTRLIQTLQSSPEFRGRTVDSIYQKLLGRTADQAGHDYFVWLMGLGVTVEQVETIIISSPEYYQRVGGAATTYLIGVYHDLLGRAIDSAGLMGWSALGNFGNGLLRTLAAGLIVSSAEANQNLVQSNYQKLLHRAADAGGLNFFAGALAHGLRDQQLGAILAASDEYFAQF
jgi:hypothetical protein